LAHSPRTMNDHPKHPRKKRKSHLKRRHG
jgi:hypothetical protein